MFGEIENIHICPSSEKKIIKTVRVTGGGGPDGGHLRVSLSARHPAGYTGRRVDSGRGARGGFVRPAGHLWLEALASSAPLMSCSGGILIATRKR